MLRPQIFPFSFGESGRRPDEVCLVGTRSYPPHEGEGNEFGINARQP
jgi:hypothetical protein